MTINTPIYTTFIGSVVGLAWSFALSFTLTKGLIYGGIIGLALGLFLSYVQYSATKSGNIQKGEAGFVTGSLLGLLLWVGLVTAFITWLIKLFF